MLCSAAELELSDDHDGIIDLPEDAPVGVAYATYAGLDDPVIDVNLTPNRPDATAISGIARDLAAAGLGTLKTPPVAPVAGGFDCPVKVKLDFAPGDEKLCPAFALRLVRGVKQRPLAGLDAAAAARDRAPADQRAGRHHQLSDLRPRPAAARLRRRQGQGRSRRAPRASQAKAVLALDGRTYALSEANVVIADENGVESIAGVMGGEHLRLRRKHDRRADRKRAVGPRQYRAHGARSRHRHRRALSLRARRRSGFLRARRRARDRAGHASSAAASRRGSSSPATRRRRASASISPIARSSG